MLAVLTGCAWQECVARLDNIEAYMQHLTQPVSVNLSVSENMPPCLSHAPM